MLSSISPSLSKDRIGMPRSKPMSALPLTRLEPSFTFHCMKESLKLTPA